MNAHDKYIIKIALKTLQAAGGTGVTAKALKEQMDLAHGEPLSSEEHDLAFEFLSSRGWMTHHLEPVWHTKRYTLTERGLTALEAM